MRVNHRQRFNKVIRRRKRAAHKRRVGPMNYTTERVFIFCPVGGEIRNIKELTTVGGGVGIGPCAFCLKDEVKMKAFKERHLKASLEKIEEKKDE